MIRLLFSVLLTGMLALFVSGCAQFGTPPEIAETRNILEDARMAGAEQNCPQEFKEAWAAWERAERLCPCSKQEAEAQAEVAMAKAQALCTDSDEDGVPDEKDECPGTPAGVQVDAVGCPVELDSDGDGVPDNLDQCPETPAGVEVDDVGCPLDSDLDGVPDYQDQCPDTPKNVVVDETGCPVEARRQLQIQFDFDEATIRPNEYPVVEQMAELLEQNPEARITVEGHTDNIGSEQYNMDLSQRRAESVKEYLIEEYDIEADRIETEAYGESRPIADNSTREGRQQNRRVVGEITKYERQ